MHRIVAALALSCLLGCATGVGDDLGADVAPTTPAADTAPKPGAALLDATLGAEPEPAPFVPPPCFTHLSCACDGDGKPKAGPMPAYCAWYDAQSVCEHVFSCDPR